MKLVRSACAPAPTRRPRRAPVPAGEPVEVRREEVTGGLGHAVGGLSRRGGAGPQVVHHDHDDRAGASWGSRGGQGGRAGDEGEEHGSRGAARSRPAWAGTRECATVRARAPRSRVPLARPARAVSSRLAMADETTRLASRAREVLGPLSGEHPFRPALAVRGHPCTTWTGPGRRRRRTAGVVLCVHGNPTWSFCWRRIVEALSPRPRGRSGPPGHGTLELCPGGVRLAEHVDGLIT